jgi:type IV secretory pathway VirB10-like protein
VLEEGDAREAILENNIIGENGVVTARFVGNFFSSRGKLIALYGSRIYGSFQYQKKNGFSYYILSFSRIVSPCGLSINLQPNNKVTLSGIISTNNTKVGQKISISALKNVDFKSILNENINVECDYSAMQRYLK